MTPRSEDTMPPTEIQDTTYSTGSASGTSSSSKINSNSSNINSATGTFVVQPDPDLDVTYIHCTTSGPIPESMLPSSMLPSSMLPSTSSTTTTHHSKSAKEINETQLQLFLGYPFLQRSKNPITLQIIHIVFTILLVEYWEQYIYYLWNTYIPISFKRYIIYQLWYIYFPIHRSLLHNRTGIHPNASMEYHALTTSMYFFRYLPNSIIRMRFALRQLTCCQPESYYNTKCNNARIERIDTEFLPAALNNVTPSNTDDTTSSKSTETTTGTTTIQPPDQQKNFCRVKGLYLHYNNQNHDQKNNDNNNNSSTPTEYTIFWLYGGAFVSGDVHGNLGPADTIAYHTQQQPSNNQPIDVFLVEYRLAPEYHFDDIIWDVVLAYRYLYDLRKSRQQDPNKILLFSCSSGAALCIRLMQYISEIKQQQYHKIQPSYIQSLLDGTMMPSGAVLASPYLDYSADLDPHGSFVQYSRHDLIVTEAVQEVGLPYLNTHMGPSGNRTTNSPFDHTMEGLPPLCIIVSQHETVYDETIRFIQAARKAGVPVTVGIWKYMCHVFLFFNGFIPEAKQAMNFICTWYQEHINHNN